MSFQSKISKNPHHLLEARNQPLQLAQPRQNAVAQCLVKTRDIVFVQDESSLRYPFACSVCSLEIKATPAITERAAEFHSGN